MTIKLLKSNLAQYTHVTATFTADCYDFGNPSYHREDDNGGWGYYIK